MEEVPFFQRLPAEARTWLAEQSVTRDLATGEVLFRQGEAAESMYLILSGQLAIMVAGPGGTESMIRVARPGAVIGEFAVIVPGQRRSATGVALRPTRLRVLHRSQFEQARAKFPAIDQALVTDLALRLIDLSDQAVADRHSSVRQRLVDRLLAMDAAQGGGPLLMNQDQLGQMVGCSRQAVNAELTQGAALGLVKVGRGRVEVLDGPGLRRWAAT